jgi:hypothetical protein
VRPPAAQISNACPRRSWIIDHVERHLEITSQNLVDPDIDQSLLATGGNALKVAST